MVSTTTKNTQKDGFSFFFDAILELLSDDVFDSYRVPAMSMPFRFNEAAMVSTTASKNIADRKILIPIIEEIEYFSKEDFLLKDDDFFKSSIENLKEIHSKGDLRLLNSMSMVLFKYCRDFYNNNLFKKIKYTCLDGKNKYNAYDLAKSLCSYLTNCGYSRRYIIECAKESKNNIDLFEKMLNFERNNYTVIIPCESLVATILNELGEDKYKIIERDQICDDQIKYMEFKTSHDKEIKYVQINVNNQNDQYRAYSTAQKMVNSIISITRTAHIDVEFDIGSKIIVKKQEEKEKISENIYKIDEEMSPIKRRKTKNEIENIRKAISRKYDLLQNEETNKSVYVHFQRSIFLFLNAYEAKFPETQIINLWSAFEALLPEPTTKPRISFFLSLCKPAIGLHYLERRISAAYDDVRTIMGNQLPATLGATTDDEALERFVRLLTGEHQDKEKINAICDYMSKVDLKMNSLWKLSEVLRSPKQSLERIETHEKIVSWQLNRIYRLRNSLSHAGFSWPFIEVATMNMQEYYDNTVEEIHLFSQRRDLSMMEIFNTISSYNTARKSMLKRNESVSRVIDMNYLHLHRSILPS
ncbi:hypothetical protein [Radicibacter daui]|uniref:hypothetical protein n=1 Tax=Radicibacter daui TaxID=3064829 RepID=UPI004046A226